MTSTTSLSIFLLKPGKEKDFDRDLGDDRTSRLPLASPLEGFFSAFRSDPKNPTWATQVATLLATPGVIDLETQSPGGLLFVRRKGRAFVLTFGHAWMRLRNEWLEHDFGRRVALNLMKEDSLIELRTEQVFAKWHLASERAPRGSSVDSFGVEFDRDMVSVVEGLSTEVLFGRTIRGGTSLRVNIDIDDLASLLDRALAQFGSNAYQKRWPDIDNLVAVRDPVVVGRLEKDLDAEFAAGQSQPATAGLAHDLQGRPVQDGCPGKGKRRCIRKRTQTPESLPHASNKLRLRLVFDRRVPRTLRARVDQPGRVSLDL